MPARAETDRAPDRKKERMNTNAASYTHSIAKLLDAVQNVRGLDVAQVTASAEALDVPICSFVGAGDVHTAGLDPVTALVHHWEQSAYCGRVTLCVTCATGGEDQISKGERERMGRGIIICPECDGSPQRMPGCGRCGGTGETTACGPLCS